MQCRTFSTDLNKTPLMEQSKNITTEEGVSLDDPGNFINSELSWLKFNRRVLEEAMDERQPLLERVKFLAICGSNIDEFFMVRVSSLRRQLATGAVKARPDRMSPSEQMEAIRKELIPLIADHARCWYELFPKLSSEGIHINRYSDLEEKQKAHLRRFFEHEIFPTLTPLAFDAAHPFPFISNLTINIAVVVRITQGNFEKQMFARVKVPAGLFSRFIAVPEVENDKNTERSASSKKTSRFVLLEDLIASNLDMLFPGMEVVASYSFRITRDAEIKAHLNGADDLANQIEESLESRRTGPPVRLEVDMSMPEHIRHMLADKLGLPSYLVSEIEGIMGTVDLWELTRLDRPDLKDAPFVPSNPTFFDKEKKMFPAVRNQDVLFYYPYDSFLPFIKFLHQAAQDPGVLAIKITLYRIDAKSPVIDALIKARRNGKQVAAVVELTARFDEEKNIGWGHTLEHAGVHVVYGSPGLKVHAKLCLVVRREGKEIIRYGYLSSGNFNAVTSRIYGDLGYFTCNPQVCEDISTLFNALTGYYGKQRYHKLLVAPYNLRREFLGRIEREIERHKEHGDGYMAFKNNGLTDMEIIMALYRASQAGVKIDLNVRALCALRPGVPGISENITVTSIVGRFLEHARIYYFRNGGDEEILLGSADLRTRNFDERVETLFPVDDADIKSAIIKDILNVHLKDNVKARRLLSDETYERVVPSPGEKELDSQEWLIENRGLWHGYF
ncbi:Polyphosphate kinase [uncultured archaeon]|nr:Polyphosphate kinase [uncultured archaeon]